MAAALYRLLYETGVIPGRDARTHAPAEEEMPAAVGAARRTGRPHLDARQRSPARRQIGPLDAVLSGGDSPRDIRSANDDDTLHGPRLALAVRGIGYVEPNPPVGCVIVRDGEIIGEGFHERFGGPHAEVNALTAAGEAASAAGATAYVTLEPCCHHGKTPPCTQALIAAGVKRVVAAVKIHSRKSAAKASRH